LAGVVELINSAGGGVVTSMLDNCELRGSTVLWFRCLGRVDFEWEG
jgi:hypothetical protein